MSSRVRHIDEIVPIDNDGYVISGNAVTPIFTGTENYPYDKPPPVNTTSDDDIKLYQDPNKLSYDVNLLELINNSISKLVADIKKTYLGSTNAAVNQKTLEIIDALDMITADINEKVPISLADTDPNKITTKTQFFKIKEDETQPIGDKFKYDDSENYFIDTNLINADGSETQTFSQKNYYNGTIIDTNTFKTLDIDNPISTNRTVTPDNPDGINLLKNRDYMRNTDGTYLAPSVNQIQTRLNNCYTLELLYMRKHEEILKLFAFLLNLFDKYKYAIKLILYLLKSLVHRPGAPSGEGCGKIKLPRILISQIGDMVEDQVKIQEVVNIMDTQIRDIGNPLDGTGKAPVIPNPPPLPDAGVIKPFNPTIVYPPKTGSVNPGNPVKPPGLQATPAKIIEDKAKLLRYFTIYLNQTEAIQTPNTIKKKTILNTQTNPTIIPAGQFKGKPDYHEQYNFNTFKNLITATIRPDLYDTYKQSLSQVDKNKPEIINLKTRADQAATYLSGITMPLYDIIAYLRILIINAFYYYLYQKHQILKLEIRNYINDDIFSYFNKFVTSIENIQQFKLWQLANNLKLKNLYIQMKSDNIMRLIKSNNIIDIPKETYLIGLDIIPQTDFDDKFTFIPPPPQNP